MYGCLLPNAVPFPTLNALGSALLRLPSPKCHPDGIGSQGFQTIASHLALADSLKDTVASSSRTIKVFRAELGTSRLRLRVKSQWAVDELCYCSPSRPQIRRPRLELLCFTPFTERQINVSGYSHELPTPSESNQDLNTSYARTQAWECNKTRRLSIPRCRLANMTEMRERRIPSSQQVLNTSRSHPPIIHRAQRFILDECSKRPFLTLAVNVTVTFPPMDTGSDSPYDQ